MLNIIKEDLSLLQINHDVFTSENKLLNDGFVEEVFNEMEKSNLLYEGETTPPKGVLKSEWLKEKHILFKSKNFGDDEDRVVKKHDGSWTYFMPDIAYHKDKFNRGFCKMINIWGADHIGYIPRMRSILKTISASDDYLEILTCQIVRLIKNNEILKMSKREGNFITLQEVYDQVGKDPLRYFMVSTKSETSMDFDLNKVIEKNKDNPVFYCQYAYARASSVINKAGDLGINIKSFNNFSEIIHYLTDDEIQIILKLLSLSLIHI